MQKRMKEYLNELKKQQQRRRKTAIAAVLLVVLVVGMVANGLTGSGAATTGEGLEEQLENSYDDLEQVSEMSLSYDEPDEVEEETLPEEPEEAPVEEALSEVPAEEVLPEVPAEEVLPEEPEEEVPAEEVLPEEPVDETLSEEPDEAPAEEISPEEPEEARVEETLSEEPDVPDETLSDGTVQPEDAGLLIMPINDVEQTDDSDEVEGLWSFDAYYVDQSEPKCHKVELTKNFDLKYQMEFHADQNYTAGSVEIRIDAALFKYRDGTSVKPSDISVPYGTKDDPKSNRSTAFNYYYEEENGIETLVFFNYKDIPSGSNAAWQVLYRDQKLMNIKDGEKWATAPIVSINDKEYMDFSPLTGEIESGVSLNSVTKSSFKNSSVKYTPGLYTRSQVEQYIDGDVPDVFLVDGELNTAGWRFVVWQVRIKGTATQPWNLIIEDVPGAEGKVVGYKNNLNEGTNYELVPIGPVDENGYALRNQTTESWGNLFWVVTAYPAEKVSGGTKVTNDITVKLEPCDSKEKVQEAKASTATWNYKEYDWKYDGNIIGVKKETDQTNYFGWLNAYRMSREKAEAESGESNGGYGDMPFTTTGRMQGYSYTHQITNSREGSIGDYIPGTYYTLTTVDDFMYLSADAAEDGALQGYGQIMGKDDYYFSGVTVTQRDYGYDVWKGKEVDYSQLSEVKAELLPEVLQDGSKVRIYAMLADPSDKMKEQSGGAAKDDFWYLIDTETLDENGQMDSYSFPGEIIAQQPWRVKVEHDTIDYKTVCNIDVNVCIKHKSGLMEKLISDREKKEGVDGRTNEKSPYVKFENLSGVMGIVYDADGREDYLVDDGKTGDGGGDVNYNGRDDLREATNGLYEKLLIRDNVSRTVSWLNETAAASKMARSTNDVDNNRVLVNYYLTAYDGYEIYNKSSLDYLRAEDQRMISPGRSHVVFYDLLPYGMQFDASNSKSIIAGRVTDLRKDTYLTEPKSWNRTGVTVTVDPKKDIITNYRGTGRTMIAFHISFSGSDATSYTEGKWIEGWGVSFPAYYDWKDMDRLNNIDINANLCAFMPDFSELAEGSNEEGKGNPRLLGLKTEVNYDNGKRWDKDGELVDVDGDPDYAAYVDMVKPYQNNGAGNIDGYNLTNSEGQSYDETYLNVLYAKNVLNDNIAVSSEAKIEKLVRADANRLGTFGSTAVVSVRDNVPAGDDAPAENEDKSLYTYDITVSSGSGIKNIAIFDRLEQAATDRKGTNDPFASEFKDGLETWSGTFRSVDETGLKKQGINNYTIYYSDDSKAPIPSDGQDPSDILQKGKDWYEAKDFAVEKGENWQEKVKAVAVKLDADYRLLAGKSISFQIRMEAPNQLKEGEAVTTYNNAFFSSVPTDQTAVSGIKTRPSNSVKVTVNNSGTETLEIIKKTKGDVPAARLNEEFRFQLYENTYEGKPEKSYLAYREYELYKLGREKPESGVYSTDGNGYFSLHADEKAVFKMADAGQVQVEETESVFWKSETVEGGSEDGKTRIVTVTNTYRPVLYAKKTLSAVPNGLDVSAEEFTFKIEIKKNDEYVPLKNSEFWYVDSARLDGGMPKIIRSDKTGDDGSFTIKKDEVVALFPGVTGTEYRLSEPESGENWICEDNTMTGIMPANGTSLTIDNNYKWKDFLLTKDITHQTKEDYDKKQQPFTFRISEVVEMDEDGKVLSSKPVEGKNWVLLDEFGNEITGTPDKNASESENTSVKLPTSGVLKDGKFTCIMGFRTVRIKDLEAGKTYMIEELDIPEDEENGQPLYIVTNNNATTTMPVFSTTRKLIITNDYQKRPLSVKKTVLKASGSDDNVFYRFTATVKDPGTIEAVYLTKGTEYTVTKAGGEPEIRTVGQSGSYKFADAKDENDNVLDEHQFMLADGETATFKDVGMVGAEIEVWEIDNSAQVYPDEKDSYKEEELSGNGAEAFFVNGDSGSLMIGKKYVGRDDSEIGNRAAEDLNAGRCDQFVMNVNDDNSSNRPAGTVDYILEITDSEGPYIWPESSVTVKVASVEENGDVNEYDRVIEKNGPITVAPWETVIIPIGDVTGIPEDATYTLRETEESKNQIGIYSELSEDFFVQISQSAASDTLSMPASVSARPSAVIYNEIRTIEKVDHGSTIKKQMTPNSAEVPNGKKLIWRVEQYDGRSDGLGKWEPAEGISYVVTCEGKPVSHQMEHTKADGWITLSKVEYGYPQVWFPENEVYLNLYMAEDIKALLDPNRPLLRIVEVPEESDKEWGRLVGYLADAAGELGIPGILQLDRGSGFDDGYESDWDFGFGDGFEPGGDMEEQEYSLFTGPEYATAFVNSNDKASLEVEKYMSVGSNTVFTMILEQVVSTGCDPSRIDSSNYMEMITATRPGAGIPYTIYNANGSVAGSGVTGSGGEIELEAGQYASVEVPDGTVWTLSEKTSASPNYSLKDMQPEAGDSRMKKLNTNLMMINVPKQIYTAQYRIEWYLADGTLLANEPRSGYVGKSVSASREDKLYLGKGYQFREDDERNRTEISELVADGEDMTLKLYFDLCYTVTWYDSEDGHALKTDTRIGDAGNTVSVLEADKELDGYVFVADGRNVNHCTLTSEGPNELKLYFRKLEKVSYQIVRQYYKAGDLIKEESTYALDSLPEASEGTRISKKLLTDDNKSWSSYQQVSYMYIPKGDDFVTLERQPDGGYITITLRYEDLNTTYVVTYWGKGIVAHDFEGLKSGSITPAYGSIPTRDGYRFIGWNRPVNPYVSSEDADDERYIEYIAQWEPVN